MTGPEVFSLAGFAAGVFSEGMGSGGADVAACSAALRFALVFISIQTEPPTRGDQAALAPRLTDLSVPLSPELCRHATAAGLFFYFFEGGS